MDDGWLDAALPCTIYIENLDLIASDNSLFSELDCVIEDKAPTVTKPKIG